MGPLKLGRAEQVESCMNPREQEEPGGRLGLSLAQMEGYKGLPSRYDGTGYPFRLYLRPSGQVPIATEPQSTLNPVLWHNPHFGGSQGRRTVLGRLRFLRSRLRGKLPPTPRQAQQLCFLLNFPMSTKGEEKSSNQDQSHGPACTGGMRLSHQMKDVCSHPHSPQEGGRAGWSPVSYFYLKIHIQASGPGGAQRPVPSH